MILGVIEIGSGTTRLQVAEIYRNGTIRPIRVMPNTQEIDLAMALTSGRRSLIDAKMEELEDCIRNLKAVARAAGAEQIGCFGTESVRKISEQKLFDFNNLSSRVGLHIQVLPSGGEALLAFWAVVREPRIHARTGDSFVVIDLGNASADIATGILRDDAPRITSTLGLECGRRTLIRRFREAHQEIEPFIKTIKGSFEGRKIPAVPAKTKLVLVGGIATKHAWIKVRTSENETYDKDPKRVDGVSLTGVEFGERARQVLGMAQLDPEAARKFVDPRSPANNYDEVDAVIAGGLFVEALLSRVKKQECIVSSQTARFGALYLMAHTRATRSRSPSRVT
jgi:exopolyphosphatase/pppGpp-phosphohydrolase